MATSRNGEDLDPDIRRFVETTGAEFRRIAGEDELSPQDLRRVCEQVREPWRQGGPTMARTVEALAPTRHGEVRLRIHDPSGAPRQPALIYLHGGGWTIFSLDSHDRLMREYAARAGVIVVGVDYALSPEVRFPVALEQTVDVTRWLAAHGSQFDIDPRRLAIGGDSAGGNLAIGVCLSLRDAGEGGLVKAMLHNYSAFDDHCSQGFHDRFGGPSYMLSSEEMVHFWNNYAEGTDARQSPLARSITANLEGLPPAFLTIPECDVLSEQSLRMTESLRASGVPVRAEIYKGATHSFLEAVAIAEISGRALQDGSDWLRETLAAA